MTNHPVAPVVTDEMVEVAVTAYDHECEDFDTETQDALDMHASAMRAAITAALEASGELERLRAALNDIFEMWAGSEGFIPQTAPEAYLLMLVKKMADRAALEKASHG